MFHHVQLFGTPWPVACPTPLSMGFSRQEYWSGLPFPSPGNLPDPGIKPTSPFSCIGRQILYHCATWEVQFPVALRIKCKHIHMVSEALLLFISWNSSFSILLTALQPHWPCFRSLNHVKLFMTSHSWLVAFLSEYSPYLHPPFFISLFVPIFQFSA